MFAALWVMMVIIFCYLYSNRTIESDSSDEVQIQLVVDELDQSQFELPQTSSDSDEVEIKSVVDVMEETQMTSDKSFINPLLQKQCRNAVIEHDQIQISEDIAKKAALCPEFNGMYTRESIDAFNQSRCGQRQQVRSHSKVIDHLKSGKSLDDVPADMQWLREFPVYLMLPKGSSSSIFNVLKRTNHYRDEGRIIGSGINQNGIKGSKCLFTFTRSPINRVLSGYYTINAHLYVDNGNTYRNLRYPWNFVKVHGEPERFRTFVDELVSEPHKFTAFGLHDHIMSASSIFQQHLATEDTDLRFIGKVEHFERDMNRLKELCSDYFEGDDRMVAREMGGYGWAHPESWVDGWDKYHEWIEITGSMPIYNYWKKHGNIDNVRPPAYFAMNEATYRKIVDFYIQDIKCFGYEHQISYQNFVDEQLKGYPNIYEDLRYNYERIEP